MVGEQPAGTETDEAATTARARRILDRYRVFAVVGASPSKLRPSHRVMRVLLEHGYDVVPVGPHGPRILGREVYPDLATACREHAVEVVDIFRRSDHAGAHVDEAITVGAAAVWLQLGVIDRAAAGRAAAAGLEVVMDRCPAIELRRGVA